MSSETKKTYYAVLGVDQNAAQSEIQAAYRRLVQLYHPDRSGQADTTKFRQVQKAYETLSTPESRARYDQSLGTEIPVRIVSRRDRQDRIVEIVPHSQPYSRNFITHCALETFREDDIALSFHDAVRRLLRFF